jgi:DNA-binding NtrC family response regulator
MGAVSILLTLPRMARSSSSNFPSRPAATAVLLVDEDSDFREALAANLLEDGCVVYSFDHLSDLPDLDTLPSVDLFVTDAAGGRFGGMDFAEAWHRARPHVPVLVVTSDTGNSWDAWADHRGGVEVRRKPIDYERIRSALRALCPRWCAEAAR